MKQFIKENNMTQILNTEEFIGKKEEDAIKQLTELGYSTRVMFRNGESFFGTCDYNTNRCNLAAMDGKITGITLG
jgi:hypothetical protein